VIYQPSPPLAQVTNVLVDKRNIDEYRQHLIDLCINANGFIGFDIESFQEPHEGLRTLMKIDSEGRQHGKKLIFDHRRSTVTGSSFYFGKADPHHVYYINFFHADIENRIGVEFMLELLELTRLHGHNLIIHNSAYEIAAIKAIHGYEITNSLCSLQLLVTAYGPDEYPTDQIAGQIRKSLRTLQGEVERAFADHDGGYELSYKQFKVLNKFTSKTSTASHAYNGLVKDISYGYGLKPAVKSWFGHQMDEFKETLGDEVNMSHLRGEQVVSYGCEDAYWCYQLFMLIFQKIAKKDKELIQTYLTQENPMCAIFANLWIEGISVNTPAILEQRAVNRRSVAKVLVEMKKILRKEISVGEPKFHTKLAEIDKWYKDVSHSKYHRLITEWLGSPDDVLDYQLCTQVKCATGNAWIEDMVGVGAKPSASLSINHYMAMRYVLHVICGLDLIIERGKVLSDKEAREEMGDHPIIKAYATLGQLEQAMKLYITPYILLIDPDTDRMYPVLSSKLATRSTAGQYPNPQQLAKYSETAYVRGYYQADNKDHLLMSLDWSAVELVLIGEFSGDPEFRKAYGQLPHEDLHSSAAAAALDLDLEEFHNHPDSKELRKNVGKGSNFGYWYSGWLATTAKNMGWDMNRTKRAVEGYIERFIVAEQWRVGLIKEMAEQGFITILVYVTKLLHRGE
jgi:DNA polymerase I-like protein with 3'-5' exonuclease and polymerase domains